MSRGRTDELRRILVTLQRAMAAYDGETHGDPLEHLERALKRAAMKDRDKDTRMRARSFGFRDGRDLFTMHLVNAGSDRSLREIEKWTARLWELCVVRTLPKRERLRALGRLPLIVLAEKDAAWGFGAFDCAVYMQSLAVLNEQYLEQ